MVEGLRKNEQWQKHFAPGRTRHNILRRFQARMGGTSESSKNRGSMELGGKVKITHKLARVKSSFPGFASFSSPTKTSVCSDWHRQQNSNDLYQQIRGNPFTSSHISSLRDVELCSRQKPDFVNSVCSRRGKPDRRQKVKGVPGQPGMDAASSSVSGITKRSWLFQYRSLCNTGEPSGSCICQLETRAWSSCHRCFQCKMGFSTGLPIPSLLYDQKVPQKNSARSGTLCPDHTSVESSPWYPVILSLLVGQPLLLPRQLDLLRLPGTEKIHPLCLQNNFRLAAWPISGQNSQRKDFLRKFQISSSPPGGRKLTVSMKVPGRHRVAGVLSGRLIRFQPL